jgi:hypothetical protein
VEAKTGDDMKVEAADMKLSDEIRRVLQKVEWIPY